MISTQVPAPFSWAVLLGRMKMMKTERAAVPDVPEEEIDLDLDTIRSR